VNQVKIYFYLLSGR